jgi:hypothetical protein
VQQQLVVVDQVHDAVCASPSPPAGSRPRHRRLADDLDETE